MNFLDIIIIIVLLYGFIKGLKEGLFVEAASLVALIAGVYGAIRFSYIASGYLKPNLDWEEKYITLLAFTLTFIILVIIISLIGKLLTKIANFAHLGWINTIAGGAFGALKWALIFSVTLMVFDRFNNTFTLVSQESKNNSIFYVPIKNLANTLFPKFIKDVQNTPTQESGR